MKSIAITVFVASMLTAGSAFGQNDEAVSKARAAEDQWLALTDAGQFAASWDQAAAFVKTAVTKPVWEKTLATARAPFGAMKGRTLKSAKFMASLPGVPDGEYVVAVYDTRFEHKADAMETVTAMKDPDGAWRVSGYYVK